VAAVAKANPQTIVVLENGSPVNMPWAAKPKAIVESWYPGIGGGEAIANILFGKVNPSGKLPVTFAATEADLPHVKVTGLMERTVPAAGAAPARPAGATATPGAGAAPAQPRQRPSSFSVDYNVEGMAVGYRWFQVKKETPQFAFGYGLSYTKFGYSNLKVDADGKSVTFDVRNIGLRAGDEIAEVYVTLPDAAGEPFRKLVGFKRVSLGTGVRKTVEVPLDPLYLSVYSEGTDAWSRPAGEFEFEVGGSSAALPLKQTVTLRAR
jgi:beta-glucosidase